MEKIIVNPGMVNFIYQAHMGFHKGKLSFEVYDGNLKEMSLRLKICKNKVYDWGDYIISVDEEGNVRVIANTSYVINNGKRLFCATVSINGWLEDKGGSQFCEIDFHNVQLTSKCVMLNEMFKDNWNLQKLNIEDWDMNNVKRIDGIFKNCSRLKEICTGNWSLDEVEKRCIQKQERAKKQGNEELERILSCIKENTLQLSTKKEMYSLITKGLHINIKMSASKPEMIVILEDNLLPDNIKVYNEHLPAFGLRQCDLKSFGIEPKSDWMKRCLSRMGSWGSMYQIYIYDITKAFGIAS